MDLLLIYPIMAFEDQKLKKNVDEKLLKCL